MWRYIVIRCDFGARVLPLRDDFNPRHSVSVAGGFSCRDAGLAPIGSEQSREYLAASQSCSICEAPAPPGVTPCWFPTLSARLSFHACGWVRWFWSSVRVSCSRGSGRTCSAGRRTTAWLRRNGQVSKALDSSPRRGLCFATSREAARDTIFDRQPPGETNHTLWAPKPAPSSIKPLLRRAVSSRRAAHSSRESRAPMDFRLASRPR